jgi:hypothetical protein
VEFKWEFGLLDSSFFLYERKIVVRRCLAKMPDVGDRLVGGDDDDKADEEGNDLEEGDDGVGHRSSTPVTHLRLDQPQFAVT